MKDVAVNSASYMDALTLHLSKFFETPPRFEKKEESLWSNIKENCNCEHHLLEKEAFHMKKRRFSFGDIVSIVISVFADLLFIAATIGAFYALFIKKPSLFTLFGALLTALFPGIFVYGITTELIDFIRSK